MASETVSQPFDDIEIQIYAPLLVRYYGTWAQLVELGVMPQDAQPPEENVKRWFPKPMRYELKRKWRPGFGRSGTLRESDYWMLTIEDGRFNWSDVETLAQQDRAKRKAHAPSLGAVSRARLDRPFAAWLKRVGKKPIA